MWVGGFVHGGKLEKVLVVAACSKDYDLCERETYEIAGG